jgi:mRNA interferase RelE/StbE
MSHQIIIPKPVQKQLDELPVSMQDRILEKILSLAENPRPSGTKKLKGYENEYRVRVGDYRVRYEVDDRQATVVILNCKHRKDAYRD